MNIKKYIAMVAVAMMFAACSNDNMPDSPGEDLLADTPVVVSAGVDEPVSKAGMATADLSTLGVTIVNPNSVEYSYANIKYEKSGGIFAAAQGEVVPFWQSEDQEVTVTAYSPYNENWKGDVAFAVAADQSSIEAVKTSDLLWVQDVVKPSEEPQSGNITYSKGALNINLQHKMSKLVVNLRYSDEIEAGAKAQSLKVMYLSTGCTINAETGAMGNFSASEDIIAYKEANVPEEYKDSFEAVFPPQTMAFKLVILLDNDRDFVYYNSAFEFQSDVAYTLNLVVGKDKVLIADGGITAEDWGVVAGGRLETDDIHDNPDNN